jgi:inhibitor of Bruton tyrosine kinase
LLEELDPDLFIELDEIIRANQLAFMPFARSERAQRELLENHPQLAEDLVEARRRRIDSMRLRTRLADDEQRMASYQKLRVGSYEDVSSSHSRRQRIKESKGYPPRLSPLLGGRESGEDLPFEMDEDAMARRPSSAGSLSSPALRPMTPGKHVSTDLAATPELSRSFKFQLGESAISPTMGSPMTEPLEASHPRSSLSGAPWQESPQTFKRMGLKDIMDQAASSRVSGLSQPLKQAEASTKSNQKISQKERKRQLQRQKTEEAAPPAVPSDTTKSAAPASPWQNVKKASAAPPSLRKDSNTQASSSAKGKSPITMRQTIAGSPSAPRMPSSQLPPGRTQEESRKLSQPIPTIQSIRHTPVTRPSTVDARTPMAEILAQQRTEKIAVKEAVAKRSLQEIQQEQEFQEWWDQESRRVQEEEAQATASTIRRGKGGRGRGRSRAGAVTSQAGQVQTSTPREDGASRGDGRRGRGRGRGT